MRDTGSAEVALTPGILGSDAVSLGQSEAVRYGWVTYSQSGGRGFEPPAVHQLSKAAESRGGTGGAESPAPAAALAGAPARRTFYGPPTPESALAPRPSRWKALAIYGGGELADLGSTAAMRRAGWREGNPVLALPLPAVAVLKAALVPALVHFDLKRQRTSSHAKRERILYVAGRVALTAWNVHRARGLRTITESGR